MCSLNYLLVNYCEMRKKRSKNQKICFKSLEGMYKERYAINRLLENCVITLFKLCEITA